MRMKTNMPQLKRAKINGRKYPWPHNPMVQPMKPIAAPLWKRAPSKPAAAFWGDPDKDGVINAFDCAPHNKRRQGPQHEMTDSEVKNRVFSSYLKKVRGEKMTVTDKRNIEAWKMAGKEEKALKEDRRLSGETMTPKEYKEQWKDED